MGEAEAGRGSCCEERRRLLLGLVGLGAAAVLPACGRGPSDSTPPAPPSVEIPVSKLPVGVRVVLPVGHQPVEFLRTADGVAARSLACTHQGCEVLWVEDEGIYQCPCHEGKYDSRGNVLAGPPPAPLRSVAAEIRGDVVVAHL